MKTNIKIKDEPVEIQNYSTKTVNELLRLYDYDKTKKFKTNSSKDSTKNLLETSTCAWCQKIGSKSFTLHTDNGDLKILCSEVCFNQYRRASFKNNKSTNYLISEKKSKPIVNRTKPNHHQDKNQRKLCSQYRRSTPIITKSKTNEISRRLSPSSSSKEKTSLDHLMNFDSIDIHRFRYPFFTPTPQMPFALPLGTASSEHIPTGLSQPLTNGLISNYTCILPTFIPLPIPLRFPIHWPCMKCSTDVNYRECQTKKRNHIHSVPISQKRARRMSI